MHQTKKNIYINHHCQYAYKLYVFAEEFTLRRALEKYLNERNNNERHKINFFCFLFYLF